MTKLDWERANKRANSKRRRPSGQARAREQAASRRAQAFADFVDRHELNCFACETNIGPWAKTGINKRGPWAICVPCVQDKAST